MTTKVTVDAHAGWPIRVTLIDVSDDYNVTAERDERVEAGETKDFYIHSNRMIRVIELREAPAAQPAPAPAPDAPAPSPASS